MGESSHSPLYFWCCSCSYKAWIIYWLLCVHDFIFFMNHTIGFPAFVLALKDLGIAAAIIAAAISLPFFYLAIKGLVLLCTYKSNLADGTLHSKTVDHLKVRSVYVYCLFAYAILFPGVLLIFGLVSINKTDSADESDKILTKSVLFILAGSLVVGFLIEAFFQLGLQRSFEKANDTISDKGPQGGLAQEAWN